VVTTEDNDGVIIKSAILENIKELSNTIVYIADSAVISSPRTPNLLVTEILTPEIANLEQTFAVGVLLLFWNPDLGQVDIDPFIEVPIFLLDRVRIMRMCQGHLKTSATILGEKNRTSW